MIRIDFSDITRNLGFELDADNKNADAVAKKMGLDIFGGLVRATPVDTGAARNSWKLDDNGQTIEVSSDSPYMNRLNMGHSKQAPSGWIENVIDGVTRQGQP